MTTSKYAIDAAKHPDLVFIDMELHNELVRLKEMKATLKPSGPEERAFSRNYLRTFISLVEALSSLVRVELLRLNESGVAPLPERVRLQLLGKKIVKDFDGNEHEQPSSIGTFQMFKLTWEYYSKHVGKSEEWKSFQNTVGYEKVNRCITKRNAITHPKSFLDLIVSKEQLEDIDSAREWHFRMTQEVLKDNIHEAQPSLK